MTQTSLFDRPAPYVRGSSTSRAAAASLSQSKIERDRATILAFIAARGPVTDEEQQAGTGIGGNTQRPRRLELADAGLIKKAAEKKRTLAGNRAVAWERA